MKKYRRYRRGAQRHRWKPALLLAGIALLAGIVLLDARMRPVIENMAAYQAKVFTSKIMNEAMLAQLEKSGVQYDDIIHVVQKNDGELSSIQTDMVEVNRLKTEMTKAVVEKLEDRDSQSVQVPIGSLMGVQLTSGRGPKIEIRVIPVGYAHTELYNNFISAGINQTLHQIMIKTSVKTTVIVPGYTVQTETVTNFCIAETVIVGSVPEAFTQIDGDNRSTISKINDYAAVDQPAGTSP